MSVPIYIVDAFTNEPHRGNPAAVCLLKEAKDPGWMQRVAAEMNLSETAFVFPAADGYSLRWFTPVQEVDLCGHATLAAAHIMQETGAVQSAAEVRFHTLSGLLTASKAGDWWELDFPAEPPEAKECPDGLLEALGIGQAHYVGRNRLDYLVEVESPAELRSLQPDFASLAAVGKRGVIVTSDPEPGSGYDFLSRAFFPAVGVNEDPVTGSAHCCLGPYWQRKLNKNELLAYQASQRGGVIRVRTQDGRVKLGGQAVTMLSGSWTNG
jgi:PhzF family phenazine biosynthesis protein